MRIRLSLFVALELGLVLSIFLAGCKLDRSVVFQPDGSGVQVMELIIDKEIPPLAIVELRSKLLENPELSKQGLRTKEYINQRGDTVFQFSGPFQAAAELNDRSERWDFRIENTGLFQKQYRLQVLFVEPPENTGVPIEVEYRVRMPGKIEQTNGIKLSENEVVWRTTAGFQQGTRFDALARGAAASITMVAAGALLLVLLAAAIAGWRFFSRRSAIPRAAEGSALSISATRRAAEESMSRPCIKCGAQNAVEARFCRSCGHSFEADATSSAQPTAPLQPSPSERTDSAVVCAKCGKENRAGTKFCRGCGAALEESLPENAAQEPHALVRPSAVPTPQKAVELNLRPPYAESITPSRTAPQLLSGRQANQWKTPAMIVGGLALIGVVGWFGYLRFAEKSSTATELTTNQQPGSAASAPQATGQEEPPAPAVATEAPAESPPPVPADAPQTTDSDQPALVPAPVPELSQLAGAPQAAEPPQTPPAPATAAPALAPQQALQPAALGADPESGCQVWKPNVQPNESVKWTGRCSNSLAEGPGKAEWLKDGTLALTYDGTFRAGLLQGHGKMVAVGGDRYDGDYLDGKREGLGTYVAASGERYEGEWHDNKREGRGVLAYASGDRYEGDFRDNKREGRGIYTKPDGERYEGEYRNDRREGNGILTRADGSRYEGLFKEGKALDASGGR